jgi:hypothetical protein
MELNVSYDDGTGGWTFFPIYILIRLGRRTRTVAAMGVALLLGLEIGRRIERVWPQTEDPIPGATPIEKEERTLDSLLLDADTAIRSLATSYEETTREARANRIKYTLMREQGFAEDSPECRRLAKRQKGLDDAVRKIERDRGAIADLRSKLLEERDRNANNPGVDQDLAEVRAELEVYLAVEGLGGDAEVLISDERWEGGGDAVMEAVKESVAGRDEN